MIVATVSDNGMGKWVLLECQHPVKTGKHVIIGGKSQPELLEACGMTFPVGPFTEADKLADRVEEHEQSHAEGTFAREDELAERRKDQES
jgi:hypothetical protein